MSVSPRDVRERSPYAHAADGSNSRFDFTAEVPAASSLGAIHFIAIGGAGMSGVARVMLARGLAVSAPDDAIPTWMRRVAATEGIAICPETAICFAVLDGLIKDGRVRADEEIVVFNTGAAQKYLEVVPLDLPRLDKNRPIAWSQFA